MNDHLVLDRPIMLSLTSRYKCPMCGERLWIECAPHTRWQEWLYTKDHVRHYKKRCNITAQVPPR